MLNNIEADVKQQEIKELVAVSVFFIRILVKAKGVHHNQDKKNI